MTSETASERRQATILFADISGFTSMSEKLDPEEVTSIVDECFALLGSIVKEQGGVIDKFIGDCVMALFGAPKALENAPEKAVGAALRMREAIAAFNENRKLAIPLGIHIGINSGEVVSGHVGSAERRDFTVMGDTVNLASRLKDIAETGQIIVGPPTWRSTREAFRFEPRKPVEIKGKSEPVQVYEVSGRIERRSASRSDRMIQSVLVGREDELGLLEGKVRDLVAGSGSIVNLVGEAGIGKSRLCAELYAKDFMKDVTLLEGRALSSGQTLGYYPIIEILKAWTSISEDDGEEAAFFKLESAVRAVAPEEAEEILPFVATLMGYKPGGKYASRLEGLRGDSIVRIMAKQLKDLVTKASSFRPILFMLEDLHWADDSSIELLESLTVLTMRCPVMFLCSWRPGYAQTTERFHRFVEENLPDHHLDIELGPLVESQSGLLAKNLLRSAGVSERVIGSIVEKSGGNPFFIEEVIRSFIDMGAMKVEKSVLAVSGDLEAIEIPNSIDAVIMSRVDRLDEALRELLKLASVIGRSFFYRILARVSQDQDGLNSRLEGLKELQLIRERTRLDEVEYIFKHVLVQETIYRSILLKSRKELHFKVARAIEEGFAGRLPIFYGVLAYHYSQAEDMDKAEEYLEKAGKAALESAASSEAILFLRKALEIYMVKYAEKATPRKLAEFELSIARAYHMKGLVDEACTHLDETLRHLGVKTIRGLSLVIAAARGILSLLVFCWLHLPRSKKTVDQNENRIIQIMEEKTWVLVSIRSTDTFLWGGAVIERFFRNIFDDAEAKLLVTIFVDYLCAAGILLRTATKLVELVEDDLQDDVGKYALADAECWLDAYTGTKTSHFDPDTARFFHRRGDFGRANLYLGVSGHGAALRGNFTLASEIMSLERSLSEEYENEDMRCASLDNASILALTRKRALEARASAEELVALSRKLGQQAYEGLHLSYLAEALLLAGEFEKASPLVERIKEAFHLESIHLPGQAVPNLECIVRWHCIASARCAGGAERRRHLNEARRYAASMLRLGKKLIIRYPETLHIAGVLARLRNRRRRATRYWLKGLAVARRRGLKPELGRISFEVAKALSDPKCPRRTLDKRGLEDYAGEARGIFTELGLEVDLKELEDWEKSRT